MILGAQLFTVRSYTQTAADLDCTLEQIAKMGYTTVQISAIGRDIPAATVREICDKHNLKIVVTHSDPNRILNDTDRLIEEHKVMGCKYIGMGAMPDKYRTEEWIEHFVKDYLPAARKIKEAGLLLMYHNHAFEFQKVNGGKYIYDYLVEGFAPDELGFILDTFWFQAAGTDVIEWIEKLKDRIPCVHFKDMAVVKNDSIMAPVLEGNINFKKILKALENTSCEYILVEQDVCQESPFVCLNKSYQNLAKLGLK